MISLISTMEPGRINWLPQFVRHYRARGVERFFLSLQIEPGTDPVLQRGYRAQFGKTLAALGIGEAFFLEKSFDAYVIRDHHDAIQDAYLTSDDWIVWCDSDEFQVYPLPLGELTQKWRAAGLDYVNGVMIDRVAGDGSLPRFDPMTPAWEQFPIACAFALEVGSVLTRKVAISRGKVYLSTGNHFLAKDAPRMLTPTAERRLAAAAAFEPKSPDAWVQIHHFKWDATVLERLRFRLSPQWKAKCPWWVESDRLLNYFDGNGGRFKLSDLKIVDFPPDKLILFKPDDATAAEAVQRNA
jgi:hypothetical protein